MSFCKLCCINSCNKPLDFTAKSTSHRWRQTCVYVLSNDCTIRIDFRLHSQIMLEVPVWRPLKILQVNLQRAKPMALLMTRSNTF